MSKTYAELRPKARVLKGKKQGGDASGKKRAVVTGQSELLKYIETLERKEKRAATRAQGAVATGEGDEGTGGLSLSEVVAARERQLLDRVSKLRKQAGEAEARTNALSAELASLKKAAETDRAAYERRESELKEACSRTRAEAEARAHTLSGELESLRKTAQATRAECQQRESELGRACSQARAEAEQARRALAEKEQELRERLAAAGNDIAELRGEVSAAQAHAGEREQSAEQARKECRVQAGEIAALKAMSEGRLEKMEQLRALLGDEKERWEGTADVLREIGTVLKRIDAHPARQRTWQLRDGAGPVYGPVPLAVLGQWAAECRIGPGHEISRDGKKWQPAHRLKGLRMTWTPTLVNGRKYGPLHLSAVNVLVADGAVAGDADVSDSATGRRYKGHDLAALEAEELRKETGRLSATIEAGKSGMAEIGRYVKQMEKTVAGARGVNEVTDIAPRRAASTPERVPPVHRPAVKLPQEEPAPDSSEATN